MSLNGRTESISYRYSWTAEYAGLPTKTMPSLWLRNKNSNKYGYWTPRETRRNNGRGHPRRSRGIASGEKFNHQIAKPRVYMISTMFLVSLKTWSNNTFQCGHVESVAHKIYTCYLRNFIKLCTYRFVQPTLFKLCQTRRLDVIATRSHKYLCTILKSHE